MIFQWKSWITKRPDKNVSASTDIYKLPRTSLVWIIASLVSVILPHILRLPVWLTLFCLGCITTSVLIFQGRISYPGSKIKTVVVFLVITSIVFQYGRDIFSTDAIVGVLLVGVTLKLLEMKLKRDVLMVIYLCYFTVLAEFIYSQAIPVAVYMILCIVIITSALMSITQTEEYQRPVRTLKLASLVLFQSVPLMAMLFLLFPRIGPLWAVPLQNASGVTGLSDEMAPGDIGDLTRSGDVAFRVEFASEIPNYNELYWRGVTLDTFDGRGWSRGINSFAQFLGTSRFRDRPWFEAIEYQGRDVKYNVNMEPTQQNWIYTLMVPQIRDQRFIMRQEYQVETRRPIGQRLTYDATSYLEYVVDPSLSREISQRTRTLPETGNDQSREFARQLYSESGSDREFVNAVLEHIRNENFSYTLSPALLGENSIDEFLFNTREGFCEHYASAFTFLMRSAGIPARVVLGYQGGEFNKYNGTLIVRQYDAHAWTEVWLEGDGWVRVDPTAAIAPDRIEFGSQFTLQEDATFLEDEVFSMLKFRSSSAFINDLILRIEMIDYAWNRFVLNYDQGMQFSLFSNIFDRVSKEKILMTLFFVMVAFVGITAYFVLRKRAEKIQTPANALYLKFCDFISDNGISRLPGETPWEFSKRIAAIQPQWARDVTNITDIYMTLAFSPVDENRYQEGVRQLKLAVRKFRVAN